MTSNRFDPDAAAGSLQEARLVSSPELRAKIIDPVVAGALVDISVSLRKLTGTSEPVTSQGCTVAPDGWWCSRAKGHEGPCAAREC